MKKKTLNIILILVIVVSSAIAVAPRIERIDFVDASVLDVVDILAKQAGLNMVISGNRSQAQGTRTSIHLKNVTAEEAIDHILKTNGMSYERKDNMVLISFLPQDQAEGGELAVVSMKYLDAEKVSILLGKVLPGLKNSAGAAANSIILQGKGHQLDEAKKLIAAIDKPVPQILIESKVVEVSGSELMRLGFVFGKGQGSFNFITSATTKRTAAAEDLQTTLNALITEGKANIVASPKIATLDNSEAVINIGSRIPYAVPVSSGSSTIQWTVEYIDAGVKLKITPRLGEGGNITTKIQPEVSSVSEWRTTAAGEFPVITTRNAQTTLRVKDGETIIIGGLLSESDRENVSRVPIAGYLPIIGYLFQNKTVEKAKTEIVFMITPHII